MRIILLGPPGAGKGTQAELISKHFQLPKISTGDMLREAVAAKSELGRSIQDSMNAGLLIHDEIILALIRQRISLDDCGRGFLFDGFPRTVPQAEALARANIAIDFVFEIRLSDEQIIQRLSGRRIHPASGRIYHVDHNPPAQEGIDDRTGEPLIQRADDSPHVIKQRLAVFHEQTRALSSWYQTPHTPHASVAHRYVVIEGEKTASEIYDDIEKALKHPGL